MLFTFPSRYWFTIGRQGVFSLARWSSQIPTGFLVSRGTQVPVQRASKSFAYGAFTLCGQPFQDCSTTLLVCNSSASRPNRPYNPTVQARWFGLFRVRSPLLAESLLISVPVGTEMVHFPTLPSTDLCIQSRIPRHDPGWVSPFGNLRIKACLRLPEAYRSLPRPSSTPGAKAFTARP